MFDWPQISIYKKSPPRFLAEKNVTWGVLSMSPTLCGIHFEFLTLCSTGR